MLVYFKYVNKSNNNNLIKLLKHFSSNRIFIYLLILKYILKFTNTKANIISLNLSKYKNSAVLLEYLNYTKLLSDDNYFWTSFRKFKLKKLNKIGCKPQ